MSRAPEIEGTDLSALGGEAGLCARCRHRQILRSARSAFLRCARSDVDSAFPRYPPLPLVECSGFEAETPAGVEGAPEH